MKQRVLALLVLFLTAACGPTVAKCTTANCMGCCDQKTDTCLAGSEATACGAGGTLCVACPATDECKSTRSCGPRPTGPDGGAVVTCSASNCDGCCDTGGCFRGVSPEACGASGASCRVCSGTQTCQKLNAASDFGGACVP